MYKNIQILRHTNSRVHQRSESVAEVYYGCLYNCVGTKQVGTIVPCGLRLVHKEYKYKYNDNY